jgi:hypothetical protein
MNRLTLLLPLALAACAKHPAPLLPPPEVDAVPAASAPVPTEVRPAMQQDRLQGHWTITKVNGKPVQGLWLELGGEGLSTITKRPDGGTNVGTPQPRTSAYLGCNWLHLNGWTRNGDKLLLGIEMSIRTERGCGNPANSAIEEQAYAVLRLAMTMELTPPDALRLINEKGTLDLVRQRS